MSAAKEYVVIYGFTGNNYCAYCPDIPECIATGETLEEVRNLMRETLRMHLADLEASGSPLPIATTVSETVRLG